MFTLITESKANSLKRRIVRIVYLARTYVKERGMILTLRTKRRGYIRCAFVGTQEDFWTDLKKPNFCKENNYATYTLINCYVDNKID